MQQMVKLLIGNLLLHHVVGGDMSIFTVYRPYLIVRQ